MNVLCIFAVSLLYNVGTENNKIAAILSDCCHSLPLVSVVCYQTPQTVSKRSQSESQCISVTLSFNYSLALEFIIGRKNKL